MSKKNLAVFISGQGTNLNVFLENKEKFGKILVISSSPKAYGLVRAENHSVESQVLDKEINWQALNQSLKANKIDLIFLAGFMKILPEEFINDWQGNLYNIHPSLLPKYKGLNAIKKAYGAADDIGVTIHHVTPEVDAGEIVVQEIAIKKEQVSNLSLDEATKLTHQKEHQLVQAWIEKITN